MRYLAFLIVFINFNWIAGQVFDVENIKLSGDIDKRINLVILSDGYQASELAQFKSDAISFMNSMFSQSPFSEYADYFNVYIIKVPSNESGADHPGTATDVSEPASPLQTRDTYLNATFDSFGYHRLLYYEIDGNSANNTKAKIYTVLANNFPEYDQALILVNSTVYGGSGGEFPMASRGSSSGVSADEIAIHELGHSMFNLKDEYYPGDALAAEAINMTQETNTSLVKWKNWIGSNNIGIFPYGTTGNAASWNRPHQNCKMRYLGFPFCSVCKEGMVEKIHDLVPAIDSFTPVSNSIDSPTFPIDFQLNLINPIPNTLESVWTLNIVEFATDTDYISITENDLNSGMNTLTAVVTDNTSLLRVDNHDTLHVYTVTWNINNTPLGINDITSEINNFKIALYPNPTKDYITISIENTLNQNLRMDLVSLEGRSVRNVSILNSETQQIDLNLLSEGIYIANFYANQIKIASKKIVKY